MINYFLVDEKKFFEMNRFFIEDLARNGNQKIRSLTFRKTKSNNDEYCFEDYSLMPAGGEVFYLDNQLC